MNTILSLLPATAIGALIVVLHAMGHGRETYFTVAWVAFYLAIGIGIIESKNL